MPDLKNRYSPTDEQRANFRARLDRGDRATAEYLANQYGWAGWVTLAELGTWFNNTNPNEDE